MFDTEHQFASWHEFLNVLKPKYLQHTSGWGLYTESHYGKMNGDWPRFHSIVHTYRMFIPQELQNALMVNMIEGMDSYMQRKVCKEPKPTDLDEAIRRAWEVHYTTPPPAPPFTGQHIRQSLGPIRTPTFSALQAMPEYC